MPLVKHTPENMLDKRGFTLVELIVTVTILGVLTTISFVSLGGYSKNARDSVRVSDIANIEKSFRIYSAKNSSQYPLSGSGKNVTFSGTTIWNQGTFDDSVSRMVGGMLSKKPVDPQYGNEYTYSVLASGDQYSIASITEWDMAYSPLVEHAYADGNPNALIRGNYNGYVIKTVVGTGYYVLAMPSIVVSDLTKNTVETMGQNGIVINKNAWVPSDYSRFTSVSGSGFIFSPLSGANIQTSLITWSGADYPALDSEYDTFMVKFQSTYSGAGLGSHQNFSTLLKVSVPATRIRLAKALLWAKNVYGDPNAIILAWGTIQSLINFINAQGETVHCSLCVSPP